MIKNTCVTCRMRDWIWNCVVVLALYYYAKPIQAEDTTTPTNPNCGPGAGTPTCRTEFTGCAARIYYRSLSSPSSVDWTREELQQLVTETQRSVLSLDGITEALMELDAAGDDEVRMFYSQVTQPAVNYIQQDGWRYARLWVNDGTVEELDIHSIRAETRRGSAGIPAGFVFGECGTLEDLDACISPAGPALPLDTAEDGTIFTPPSNVRGDIARALFYMDLKYDSLELTDCAPFDNGRFGILSQLLQWHQQDPVSEEEFARNENACEFWQGNRNPFVDYPDLVEQFYGAPQELIVEEQTYPSCLSLNDTTPTTFPPAGNETAADPSDPCAILEPGDLFLFSMSSIDQSIGFLALVDLPPTLLLYMTDRPWNGEEFLISTDSAEEGTVKTLMPFSATGLLYMAGSRFDYADVSTQRWTTEEGSFIMGTEEGDSIMLYCILEDTSIRPILAFSNHDGTWADPGLNIEEYGVTASALPRDLLGMGSVALPHFDNYRYVGPEEGRKQDLQMWMMDPTNWEGSDETFDEVSVPPLMIDANETTTLSPTSETDDNSGNNTLAPSANMTQEPVDSGIPCSFCDAGPIDGDLLLPDDSSCSFHLSSEEEVDAESETCTYDRMIASGYCGCPTNVQEVCKICDGTNVSSIEKRDLVGVELEKFVPDAVQFTCSDLFSLPAVDGSTSCTLIYEKYARYCGCQDSPAPACGLCTNPEDSPQDTFIPFQFLPMNQTTSSKYPTQTTCQGLHSMLSVQTASECLEGGTQLVSDYPLDMESYCGCPDSTPPMVCGNLCPTGSAFIMDAIFRMPDGTSYSCEQADVAVQYTLDSQMCAEFKSAAFSVCCNITNNNGTVWDILVNNSDSSLFSQALESVNVDKLLDDYYGTFTVFAPNDNAFESEERLGIYSNNLFAWREHLTNALLNHIISGLALTFADLVAIVDDGADFRLTTLANEILIVDEDTKITVSGGLFRFSNRTIASAEIVSSNGVVHVINDFLATTWYEQTIADILEAATILDWGLSVLYGLLSQASLLEDDALTEISLNGTTLLAPSDDAYQLEADGPGADDTELLYLVVESNIHPDDLQNGTSLALSTRHPTAEIWLSVNETGALRYNGASLEEVIFANNGFIHVVDKALKPPFIMDFLEMAFNITGLSVDILVELVLATNSSLGNLAEAEADQHLTLFAPLNSNFEAALSVEDKDKLLLPLWSRHLRDMLLNLIAPLPYTYDGLLEMAQSGSAVEVIGGSSYELTLSDGGIGVHSGMLVGSSPAAVDGTVHFVESINLPASVTISTLEYITSSPDVPDTLLQVIAETTNLVETLQGSDPITMFLPSSFEDLDTTLSTEEMIDLIQNHIFDGMTFSDVLAEMDGGVITSINSKPWVVSVLDGSIFLGNEDSGDVVNVGPDVDILTKTGVVHKIDGLLSVVDNLTEAPTTTPTVIETDSPTEEPVPVPESTRAPAVETDEPTRAPAVETDEPTRAPAVETDRPTQLPSDTTTNNNPSVESNPPDGSVIVPINASFAVYNTQNLLSTTLVSRYNGEILNAAFSNFVDALVTEVEGGQQRKLRRLEATLVRDSPEIYAVRMVLCTAIDAAPNDAICHNVYGSFNLAVVGENADAVTRRYEVSANRAIEAGDLQASFDKTDLSFPFIVVGPAVPADRQASSDEKMPWWILIIIILLSIVAVGCLLFACATLFLQHKPDNRDESEAFLDQNEKRETSDDSTGNKEEDEDEEQVRLEKKSEKETLMNDPKAALSDSQGSEKESVSLESESETEHVERNGPFEESEVRSGSAHKEEEEREKSAPMSQSPLQGSTHVGFRPDGSEEMEISARDDIVHKEDQDLQDINLGTEEWEDEPIPQASWGEDAKLDSWGEDVPNGAEDENISWDDVDASTPAEDASWDENGNGDDDDDENISKLQDELGAFDRRVSSDPDQMNKGLEDDSGRGEAVLDFSPSPNSKTESSQELSKPGDNSFDSSWTEDEEPGIVGLKEGLTELNAEMDGFDKHFLP